MHDPCGLFVVTHIPIQNDINQFLLQIQTRLKMCLGRSQVLLLHGPLSTCLSAINLALQRLHSMKIKKPMHGWIRPHTIEARQLKHTNTLTQTQRVTEKARHPRPPAQRKVPIEWSQRYMSTMELQHPCPHAHFPTTTGSPEACLHGTHFSALFSPT